MKPMFRVILALVMALGVSPGAWAQADPYIGTWIVDVQNSKRMRAMVVSRQGDVLRARWGFQDSGSKIAVATAAIDAAGALTLTTNSDTVVVLKAADDNTLTGTFTPRDGKQSNVTATRSTAEALAAFNAPAAATTAEPSAPAPAPTVAAAAATTGPPPAPARVAAASTTRAFLAKAEVQTLAAGKTWNYKRADSGSDIRWELREGGALFANNYSANQKDSGTWSVNDQGQLCVKWRGNSIDRCVALLRDGDKVRMVDAAAPNGPLATLAID